MAILSSGEDDGTDVMHYYLTVQGDVMYRLAFCDDVNTDDLASILVNSVATVSYTNISEGVMYSCEAPRLHERNRRLLFGETMTGPSKPTYLVYITTNCDYPQPPATTQQVRFSPFESSVPLNVHS